MADVFLLKGTEMKKRFLIKLAFSQKRAEGPKLHFFLREWRAYKNCHFRLFKMKCVTQAHKKLNEPKKWKLGREKHIKAVLDYFFKFALDRVRILAREPNPRWGLPTVQSMGQQIAL